MQQRSGVFTAEGESLLALVPFRDALDPDEKRKEILWIAITFIIILAAWLAVVMLFGYRPLAAGLSYDEAVMAVGVGVLLVCAVLYLAAREREQRHTNHHLVAQLGATVSDLDERVRHLNGLCLTSAQLIGSLESERISHLVVDALADIMGTSSSLVFVDEESGRPVYNVSSPRSHHSDASLRSTSDHPRGGAHTPRPQEQGSRPAAWPIATLRTDGRVTDLAAQIKAWNEFGYVIAAPSSVRRGLRGVLIVRRSPSDPPFNSHHLNTLTTFANMASKAFESSDLYGELRESYLATIRSLIYSLDARDNYAAAHGHRVAELAVRIAEHMGLPEDMVRDLEIFAPLHDVGKIGIPDTILLKSGPLTAQEREACKAHSIIGERIIRPLNPGRGALALVRNHHESWDGTGYPDELQAEQIPLLARVVQVADCYDALISERPYRPIMSEDEVLVHFRVNSGVKYDPSVVAALRDMLHQDRTVPAREAQIPTPWGGASPPPRGTGAGVISRVGVPVWE
jgi:hypothetical protein